MRKLENQKWVYKPTTTEGKEAKKREKADRDLEFLKESLEKEEL